MGTRPEDTVTGAKRLPWSLCPHGHLSCCRASVTAKDLPPGGLGTSPAGQDTRTTGKKGPVLLGTGAQLHLHGSRRASSATPETLGFRICG